MQRAIVTVQRSGDPRTRELEISVTVPGGRLAEMVARSLSWDRASNGDRIIFEIEVLPLGRRLRPDEALADVGAWDGSWLILHSVGSERWGDLSDPVELVPVPEQVWSTERDLPTDIGARWFAKPASVPPSGSAGSAGSDAPAPIHEPDETPTQPDPPVTVRHDPNTWPTDLLPTVFEPTSTTVGERHPADAAVSPAADAPTTRVPVAPAALASDAPDAPGVSDALGVSDTSADVDAASAPPASTPLRGFRPWRSRRQPPQASPSQDAPR